MSHGHPSPLMQVMRAQGGVTGDYHGLPVVRHFGDPRAEYQAATEAAAVFDRSHRTRLSVTGRGPRGMLNGVLTGTIPAPPEGTGEGVVGGRATYHAVLTPKGKMVSDLWCLCRSEEEGAGDFLLDVPAAGRDPLVEHLGKYLPPRFARVSDLTREIASLSVAGPAAARHLSRLALGLRVDDAELSGLAGGEWRTAGAFAEGGVAVMRTAEVWPEAYTVYGPAAAVVSLWEALVHAGVRPAGAGVWNTLRVEAGTPVFGSDMDRDTIPVEAGIHDRAIDYAKGCYTGQEVIVRIRDRGHVNRHLRQLMLGDRPAPAHGTPLFVEGVEKPVGEVTSAVESPRFGQTVALAYVRRGTEGEPLPR